MKLTLIRSRETKFCLQERLEGWGMGVGVGMGDGVGMGVRVGDGRKADLSSPEQSENFRAKRQEMLPGGC